MKIADRYIETLKAKPADTFLKREIVRLRDTSNKIRYSDLAYSRSAVFNNEKYTSAHSYDSVQGKLPNEKKDGWLIRQMIRKQFALDRKFHGNINAELTYLWEGFLHKGPYVLFITLPFFALILKLLYIRRKAFYYNDHAIFTLYHYVFSFILILFIYLLAALNNHVAVHWPVELMIVMLVVTWPAYLLIAMHSFYGQAWGKTLAKFVLLNFVASVVMPLLFVLFLVLSIFQIQ